MISLAISLFRDNFISELQLPENSLFLDGLSNEMHIKGTVTVDGHFV